MTTTNVATETTTNPCGHGPGCCIDCCPAEPAAPGRVRDAMSASRRRGARATRSATATRGPDSRRHSRERSTRDVGRSSLPSSRRRATGSRRR